MSLFLLILTFHIKTNKHAEIYYHISTSPSKQDAMGVLPFHHQAGRGRAHHTQLDLHASLRLSSRF